MGSTTFTVSCTQRNYLSNVSQLSLLEDRKNLKKIFQKPIDKWLNLWYNKYSRRGEQPLEE
jgi:hypothetical protein